MIYCIAGRIGTGVTNFTDKMLASGYHDITAELAKVDGATLPVFDDKMPSYGTFSPDQIDEVLKAFPDEIFHIIYIEWDDYNDETRRANYIRTHENPQDAPAIFDKINEDENIMFDEFEDLLRLKSPTIPDNLRAAHRITNDNRDSTQQEWVEYFIRFHRMHRRLISAVRLGIKFNVVNTNDAGKIILFYKSKDNELPRRQEITEEVFADILLNDNTGLSMLIRNILEKASLDDLADVFV